MIRCPYNILYIVLSLNLLIFIHADNEKTFSKKDEKCEDDHIKVGGSGTKRRKRVKKLVSKMYMNDDDEMGEKLFSLYTCGIHIS